MKLSISKTVRPAPWLVSRLASTHPAAELVWLRDRKRWALLEKDGRRRHLIVVLEGKPTVRNTIGYLNRHRTSVLVNQYDRERFIAAVDEPWRQHMEQTPSHVQDSFDEGGDRLGHLLNKPVSIRKAWSDA